MASPGASRTAWHPLLVALLRKLLPVDDFEVIGEFQLTREPLRLDVLVLRKLREARPLFPLLPSLFEDMAAHTLVSFKGPTDELERDDATMLLAYAALYMVQARVNAPRDMALRLIAPELTPRFKQQLFALGGHAAYQGQGLSIGHLGPFALRVIETQRAYAQEEEHLWFAFAPALVQRHAPPIMARIEKVLYQFLYQQVAQFRSAGDPLMYKDLDLAKMTIEEALEAMMGDLPPEIRLAGLPPELLVAGVPPEIRMAGLSAEARMAGLPPEARVAGLPPEARVAGLPLDQLVPALPDEVLRGLSDEVLARLSPEARETVRKRLGR